MCWLKMYVLQELKLKHETEQQHKLRDEYDKLKFRLKCMDIELHTEVQIHATVPYTALCAGRL